MSEKQLDKLPKNTRCAKCWHTLEEHLDVCWGEQPDDSGACGCGLSEFKPKEKSIQ